MRDTRENQSRHFGTLSVHGGEDRQKYADSITTPIVQASTYVFSNTSEVIAYTSGELERFEYGRYGNPTERAAERKLATLEGAEDAYLFASGMNAETTALLALLSKGQHLIMMEDCYKKTTQFCRVMLRKFGVEYTFVKTGDYEQLEDAIQENTRVIFAESPTNPHLYVLDLYRLMDIAKKRGIRVIIDSTFATPFNQRPLEFGVDLAIHSVTKYLAGHNDIMGGAVLGAGPLVSAIKDYRGLLGGSIDPHCAYLLLRGLKTFSVRMERYNESGMKVAQYLERHPKVSRVFYPGLESHPHHSIAVKQMRGFGGVVSFEIDGDLERTFKFINSLKLPYMAPSLGGVESLVTHPSTISYYDMSEEERLAIGITDQLVRYSIGIEDVEDIIEDLEQAFEKI